ncbi:dTMP kinase [Candidatus Pacearchaeota archaeon]|nr:dTMP kinase [Candidatus Pacearchaeota archaeon]
MKRGHDYPGLLISFEGGEGSGKSTQIKLLQEYLSQQGYVISRGRCSGGTPIGERIREILQNPKIEDLNERTELLLFIGSRAESVAKIVLPTLKSGGICLHDRFRESSIAYQGHGRELSFHERVREGYIKMAQEEPDRIKVIPFQKDKIGEMQNQIRKAVDQYIAHFQLRDKLIRANP